MSGYYLRLEQFEGPLDLLLHLIRVNEIDVFNIDILLLSNQYLAHLRVLEFEDLAHVGDFLEMASTLLEIKSRMLLPNDADGVGTDDDSADDPLKDLQARLIEYETFRKASEFFEARPQLGVEIQTSSEWQRLEKVFEGVEAPLRGDPASMVILYEEVLKDFVERKPEVIVEAVTHRVGVQDTIQKLADLLKTVKFVMFQSFYKNYESRYEMVVHILAVLEMSRWGQAKVYQETLVSPLWVYLPDYDENLLPVKRMRSDAPSDRELPSEH